jgi:hypothetical protein
MSLWPRSPGSSLGWSPDRTRQPVRAHDFQRSHDATPTIRLGRHKPARSEASGYRGSRGADGLKCLAAAKAHPIRHCLNFLWFVVARINPSGMLRNRPRRKETGCFLRIDQTTESVPAPCWGEDNFNGSLRMSGHFRAASAFQQETDLKQPANRFRPGRLIILRGSPLVQVCQKTLLPPCGVVSHYR